MQAFLISCLALASLLWAGPGQAKTILVFDQAGNCLERNRATPTPPDSAFRANHGDSAVLFATDSDPAPEVPTKYIRATIQGGQVVNIALDPSWSPPVTIDPLEEMRALVRGNVLASVHDKRWLAQKEAAKLIAIPWIKANPTATQAEFQAAVFAALAAELPAGEPIVVNPDGIIASYALAAKERGLIAEASFTALRDLVVATPEKQIQKLLAQL